MPIAVVGHSVQRSDGKILGAERRPRMALHHEVPWAIANENIRRALD
jgi:hypothetical protein